MHKKSKKQTNDKTSYEIDAERSKRKGMGKMTIDNAIKIGTQNRTYKTTATDG